MQRTLQEWANFLNMYVYMNADGSVKATKSKPFLDGSPNYSHCNKALQILEVYWNIPYSASVVDIDREVVDYTGFSAVPLGSPDTVFARRYYYLGWDSSLKEPENEEQTI